VPGTPLVNCVGVLQDGLRDEVQRVQLDGTKALFDGCDPFRLRRGQECASKARITYGGRLAWPMEQSFASRPAALR